MRWRNRRRRPHPPRDPSPPPSSPQPERSDAPSDGGTRDEDLPPPSAPLPRPPVRVVPNDGPASGGDETQAGAFGGLGPEGAPADERDDDWADAASQVFAEYAHLTEIEERYDLAAPGSEVASPAERGNATDAAPSDQPPPPESAPSDQSPPPESAWLDQPAPPEPGSSESAPSDQPPPPEPADPAEVAPSDELPRPPETAPALDLPPSAPTAAEEPAPAAAPVATPNPAPSPAPEPAPAPTADPTPAPAPTAAPASAPAPAPPGAPPGNVDLPAEAVAAAARAVVRRALDEDLDVAGDVTAEATIPPGTTGRARLVARDDGVVAGLDLVALVYDHLDPRVEVRLRATDGDRVGRGDVVAEVSGPLRSVLSGERTALNLVTHLSGVATLTARYVEAVAGTAAVIRDTRKTTPGMRLLEKVAVRAGGGVNHRLGLSDALLVKDNHVAAAGGVAQATRAALSGARGRHVQVEVDSLEELELAVEAGARDVLLDNFDPEATARAVARVRELEAIHGRILLESSGGLDLDTVRAFAEAGVDRLAIGALTHSAPQLDLALDLEAFEPGPGDAGGGTAGGVGS